MTFHFQKALTISNKTQFQITRFKPDLIALVCLTIIASMPTAISQTSSTSKESPPAGAFIDSTQTYRDIFNGVDKDQDGEIIATEAAEWVYSDMFFETHASITSPRITPMLTVDQAVIIMSRADNEGISVFDEEAFQERVLLAYSDGMLDEAEIKYLSGERVFDVSSGFIDPTQTYDALLKFDENSDGNISTAELLGDDLVPAE